MDIAVIGLGKFGLEIISELVAEKHDITVIDIYEEKVSEAITDFDVIGLVGNGASGDILAEAGVENMDIVIALTGSDELNLLCCLIARKMGAKKAVARVRNPEYSKQTKLLREAMNINLAINPDMEAANEITRVIKFSSAKNVESFSAGRVDLVSFNVDKGSNLCGKSIVESFKNIKSQALICAVSRDGVSYIPSGDFVIEENDVIAFISPTNQVSGFFKEVFMPVLDIKNIMLIGAGRITYYLTEQLLDLKMNVNIVERDEQKAEEISFKYPSANVICADATESDVLIEEGLKDMDAIVCLTGIDEINVLLSSYAKSVKPDIKTITKINRISYEEVINSLNIGSVIYPKHLAGNMILQYVRGKDNSKDASRIETLYRIIDNTVEAIEFMLDDTHQILGKTLQELHIKDEVLIGGILRGEKMIIPHGNDVMMPGDRIIVVTTIQGINNIDDILNN